VEISDDDSDSAGAGSSVLLSNVDPSGVALNAPVIDENGTATVTGDFLDPGSLDTHSELIVSGPNEGRTTLNLAPGSRSLAASHQYLDYNPSETDVDVYPITATVSDDDTGNSIGRSGVTTNNIAPSGVVVNAPVIDENGIATISGSFVDPGTEDTHSVTIAWGPGEGFTTLTLTLGEKTFTASHTYLDDDPTATLSDVYTIDVWVEDDDYGVGTATSTVTVHNVAPLVVDLSSPVIDENGTATVTGTIIDPGTLDVHTIVIDWGTGEGSTTVTPAVGDRTFSSSYQYLDDGLTTGPSDIYTATASITDDDTGSDSPAPESPSTTLFRS
jgi:hypothetical protein